MSDLTRDVEEEVLCRIPMTSMGPVRTTCKRWNTLSRCELFAKKTPCKYRSERSLYRLGDCMSMIHLS
ncbi:hypothetical protein IGI04_025927 [Brassica rapa subsp. trilocularis]|uniref:F-box domain-containing protein n=1 Tax=Brassica rapa subsp. trilocularis TaxID=1813537 RepID=A0ABQ7KX92_BRACM|nr:hypothetical protein IGI04_025927 [Brassica rapa subsp. trilocularis]